jgi:predicted nuclease with RNAse H fold
MLTERGLALKEKLAAMGYQAVECFPGAAQDSWGLPRQHKDRRGPLAGLRNLGLRGLKKTATSDELDAATAALVGRWFLSGHGTMLGGNRGILIPAVSQNRLVRQRDLEGARSNRRLRRSIVKALNGPSR